MLSCPSFIYLMILLSLVLLFSPLRSLSFLSVSHFFLVLVSNFSFTLPVSLFTLSTINLTKAQLFHEIVMRILILVGTAIGHFMFIGKCIFHLIQLSIK